MSSESKVLKQIKRGLFAVLLFIIISTILADISDAMDYPKSFGQLLNWDKHEYFKNLERLKAREKRERRRIKQALWRLEKAEVIENL